MDFHAYTARAALYFLNSEQRMSDAKQKTKQQYREHALAHRKNRVSDESDFERVVDVFFENYDGENDRIIALYWPIKKEFDTRFLMDELVIRGFTVVLPVVQKKKREMVFKKWTHDVLMKANQFGILEPLEGDEYLPDIILAPFLAYDQKGNRLGYGKGHYDNTVTAIRVEKSVQYVGIGYEDQAVLFDLPTEDHDIRLDYLLTPDGVKEF